MENLQLVKSENFGDIQCDIYQGKDQFYMTREQVGRALEYENPRNAIKDIHARHKERLNRANYSGGRKLTTPSGGTQTTTVYTRKGIMEICRHSNQPKADAFMDWVWDIMDDLITGKTKLVGMTEYQQMIVKTREKNANIKEAQLLERIANQYDGTYRQVLHAHATKALTGEYLLPLPQLEAKTYSATEIGERLGISSKKVGSLTNQHNLKTDEYGQRFKDKSPYSNKEVDTFRYYENIIPVLESMLKQQSA